FRSIEVCGVLRMRSYRIRGLRARQDVPRVLLRLRVRARHGFRRTVQTARLYRGLSLEIYEANYWLPVGGDTLPAGADLAVFDASINSGPAKANELRT